MCRRNWWTRTQGARAALRLAAVLASAATLGGCGLQRSSRPDDALPLAVHHGLREVVVVTHGEGSIFVTGLVDGWDGHAPAALHAALRDGVAAEIRALGLARVVTAEDTSAFVDASVPPPVPDSLDSQGVGGPPVPPPPTPRRGAAWVEVSLARADLDWVAGSDAPAILSARFVAKITAADPRAAAAGPLPRLVAERTFTLRDREPRLPAAWAADGGAAVTAALERLVALAARRVASDLLATASDATSGAAASCGPAPKGARPRQAGAGAAAADGPVWARWEAWAPDLPRGATARIEYELRAWRLEPGGRAVPTLELSGLTRPAATLSTLGGPAAAHAWSARGVARLEDGRQLRSRWSQPRMGSEPCASEPDPWLAHRVEVAGPTARAARPQPHGPRVAVTYRPLTWEVRREGLGPDVNVGSGAVIGLGYGVKGGIQASFACGPFMPVCAAVALPLGAAVGAGAGIVVGGVSSAVRQTSRTEAAALAPEPLRGALLAALDRAGEDPALVRAVRDAAEAGLGDEAPGLALEAVEVHLVGHSGADHPASVRLVVAGSLQRPGAPPVARRVDVVMPGTVEASDLAADGALALSLAVRTQAAEAGRRLAVALLSPDPPPEPAPAPAAEPQASDDGSRYAGPPAD